MELFSIFGRILLKDDGVESKLSSITQQAQETEGSFSGSFEKMANGALRLGKVLLGGLGIKALIKKGYELAESASDLNEAQNVVENTFKKSAKSIEAWTSTTAKSAGISKTASTQWSGFMGAMLKSSGVTEQKAGDMSKKLVQLTGDMSSFYNIGISDMWGKIRSGISAETMPLKQLGINMSEANLSAYALSQGITKSYSSMSQAEKTTLRYNYLLSVTKDAQGDFGRTLSTSFANQMRVAELNMKTLGQTIGNVLLPPFMKLVTLFNENAPKVQTFLDNLTKNTSKIAPMAATFAGVAASLIPILTGMNKVKSTFGTFTGDISKFTSKIGNVGNSISKYMGSAKKIPTFFRTAANDTKIALGLLQSDISTKLSPLSSLISSKLKPITGVFNKLPVGLQVAFGKTGTNITNFFGKVVPKVASGFISVGSKLISGLKTLMSIGLKAIAPASIIATVLLGLGLLQNTMGSKIDSICKTLIEKGPAMIQKFAAKLTSQIPQMIQAGVTLLNSFINVLIANAPALIKAAVAIITSLINGLATNLRRLIPEIIQLIQTILTAIIDNLPTIILAGLKIIVALAEGISKNITQIVNAIVKVVQEIIKVVIQNLPLIIEAGIKIIVALIQGLAQATPQLIAALPSIVKAIWDGLKSADWGGLGTAIIQGIGTGLKAAAGGLLNTVKAIGSDILTGFKSMFGIHSPSTVMRDQVGKNISLGIAAGIKDVNFMKAINEVVDKYADEPDKAVKKIVELASNEVQNLRSNLSKQIKSLNAELSALSSAESKALRGVKGNKRYAIEDEYNKKKQAVREQISLRKEQADKEIQQIQRIGKMSKEELQTEISNRKSFVESVNNLNDEIKSALKAKYEKEEQTQESSINKQLDNLEDWKTKAEDSINDVFDTKESRLEEDEKNTEDAINNELDKLDDWKEKVEQNIEDNSNARIKALEAQSDALDTQSSADDRATTHKDYEGKISDLQSQIKYSHDDFNKAELQKELKSEQAEYQKELNKEALDDKKAALKKQEDTIKNDADKQKASIESIYKNKKSILNKELSDAKTYYTKQKTLMEADKKAQLANIDTIYNANKTSLDTQFEDYKAFYTNKLTDANLEAESEKMIMDNNQKEIVALLNSYGEQYKQAGQTLGDKLVEGFTPAIEQIKGMISSITSQISEARDSTISAMSSGATESVSKSVKWHADGGVFDRPSIIGVGEAGSEAVVPLDKLAGIMKEVFAGTTGNGKVVNNNVNITSPVKQTPSEQKRDMETALRRLNFSVT